MGALAFVGTPTMQLSDIQASQDVEATVVFATSLAIPADGEIVVVFPANFALTNFAGTDPYPCDKTFSDPTATLLQSDWDLRFAQLDPTHPPRERDR